MSRMFDCDLHSCKINI